MARNRATTTDIHARLAKSECANFSNNKCHGATTCLVINGEDCVYFTTYVQPLLNYPEVAARYHNEAKISVALNPKSKIVRKKRQLSLEENITTVETTKTETPKAVPAKKVPVVTPKSKPAAAKKPTVITTESKPSPVEPTPEPPTAPLIIDSNPTPKAPITPAAEEFFLELTPYEAPKRKGGRRR